ncbi:hypothetical protein SDC9_177552 [bioreactor metagenome]|uniref:Uncharacterized protein n=1 Tax=bioreactor metagenome TaxID=1076179 RepID=A0A645GTK7_9ZZZZ
MPFHLFKADHAANKMLEPCRGDLSEPRESLRNAHPTGSDGKEG